MWQMATSFVSRSSFQVLGFLLLGTVLLLSCAKERPQANHKAVEIWEGHAEVVRDGLYGKKIRDEKFDRAIDFFADTAGLVVRMDGDYIGVVPTKETEPDFKEVQQWFRKNRERLYWDEQAKVVRVKPPAGPGGVRWWNHESVVIDLVAGRRTTTDPQVAEAREFFLRLTEIDVLAAGQRRNFLLIPRKGRQRPLPQLREWYEANRDRLRVDGQTGELQISDP